MHWKCARQLYSLFFLASWWIYARIAQCAPMCASGRAHAPTESQLTDSSSVYGWPSSNDSRFLLLMMASWKVRGAEGRIPSMSRFSRKFVLLLASGFPTFTSIYLVCPPDSPCPLMSKEQRTVGEVQMQPSHKPSKAILEVSQAYPA